MDTYKHHTCFFIIFDLVNQPIMEKVNNIKHEQQ